MSVIEEVKNEGIRKALFGRVNEELWNARLAMEHAGEVEAGKFKDFAKQIFKAKEHIKSAESFYTELLNYQ